MIALFLIISIFVFAFLAISHQDKITGKPTLLTFTTTSNVETIFPEASKSSQVFFNSVNQPVKVAKVTKTADNKELSVILLAKGVIENNKYLFNGVRVAVGQKAELHGSFFAQGIIKDIKYEK